MDNSPLQCANELLEVVPLMMRVIRAKVRSHSSPELSVAQFRALAFLGRNENAMLGDVANFLAQTLPAASKLIDGLVLAGFAGRKIDPSDRRKVALTLTPMGRRKYATALRASADFLAERMSLLGPVERGWIARAMKSLHTVFSEDSPETRPPASKPKRAARAT